MIKEIPLGFDILRVKGGFAVARTQGIPSLEIDEVYDREIVPRRQPYKRVPDAKRGIAALQKSDKA